MAPELPAPDMLGKVSTLRVLRECDGRVHCHFSHDVVACEQESAASFTGVKARVDAIQVQMSSVPVHHTCVLYPTGDLIIAGGCEEEGRVCSGGSSMTEIGLSSLLQSLRLFPVAAEVASNQSHACWQAAPYICKWREHCLLAMQQADMANLRGDTVPRLRSELDDMVVARLQKDQVVLLQHAWKFTLPHAKRFLLPGTSSEGCSSINGRRECTRGCHAGQAGSTGYCSLTFDDQIIVSVQCSRHAWLTSVASALRPQCRRVRCRLGCY
eukprot:3631926-Amphidinium_carterae.1